MLVATLLGMGVAAPFRLARRRGPTSSGLALSVASTVGLTRACRNPLMATERGRIAVGWCGADRAMILALVLIGFGQHATPAARCGPLRTIILRTVGINCKVFALSR